MAQTPTIPGPLVLVPWFARVRDAFAARRFSLGLLCGLMLITGVRLLINNTGLADMAVAPLVRGDTGGAADAIVVLGAGVVGPCEPNLFAIRRTMLAARLWHEGRAPTVLFTGGPPKGLACPVAAVMRDLSVSLGVPLAATRLEPHSHSTLENATMAAPLLRKEGVRRVLVVTDRLHMTRAAGAFVALGFGVELASVPVYASHPDNVSMLLAGLREFVALGYYRARGSWRPWPSNRDGSPSGPP